LISDGPCHYRLQIKTIQAVHEDCEIENRWKESHIQYVAVFAKNSNWGYIMPAFKENSRRLNAEGHQRFQQTRSAFLKAFHLL
jgi:hypothetical protein